MSLDELMEHLAQRGKEPSERLTWREIACLAAVVGIFVGAALVVVLSGPNLVWP